MMLSQFPDQPRFHELAQGHTVIPVCRKLLADTHTPVSLLNRLHRPHCFLLESVEGGEHWGRYSFLGINAHALVDIFKEEVIFTPLVQGEGETIAHGGDPLGTLRELMARFQPARLPELPRFWGGLTGYFTYEMAAFFENLPLDLPDTTPFGQFILPETLVIFDNIRQEITALSLCYLTTDEDPDHAYERACANLDHLMEELNTPAPPREMGSPTEDPVAVALDPMEEEAVFLNGVERIKTHIKEGDVFQAVLSRGFSCAAPRDPVTVYRAQRYINPSPYMYFMDFKDRVIAGSSPETMVRLEQGKATLRPIAGTRPRGANEQEDRNLADELLKDEKETAEHVMLIDLARNDLGRVADTGTVQVTDTMVVERYSHVMHLTSNISCDLTPDKDAFDLFRAAFPAGTLSGAPKIRAMEIISGLEKNPRQIYGGAVGYISFTGNMDFAITIRTAVMENQRLVVRAGAGIVYDSDPMNELEECRNKAKSVEAALKLALSTQNGETPCKSS